MNEIKNKLKTMDDVKRSAEKLRAFRKGFNLQHNNHEKIYNAVLDYFNSRLVEDAPKSKLDTDKGILVIGPTGTGKTAMLNAVMSSFGYYYDNDQSASPVNARELNYQALDSERTASRVLQGAMYSRMIVIDDLGEEKSDILIYGTNINYTVMLLEKLLEKGSIFHATSNLNEAQLRQRYGDRLFSRMIAAFNVIKMEGNDLRAL